MSRISLILVGVLSISLCGCGGADDTPSNAVSAPAATSVSSEDNEDEASPVKRTKTKVQSEITYRPVKAKRRLSGEPIEILVPEDISIESGRMLEYRVGDDGKYYLRSVISN